MLPAALVSCSLEGPKDLSEKAVLDAWHIGKPLPCLSFGQARSEVEKESHKG